MLKSSSAKDQRMSYGDYVRGNLVKWMGIVLIILTFLPIFSYQGGTPEPIWDYFIDLNWEAGLEIGQFFPTQAEVDTSAALFQLLFGTVLIIMGKLMENSFKTAMGL